MEEQQKVFIPKAAFWMRHPKSGERIDFKPGLMYEADEALAGHWFFKSMTAAPEPVKVVAATAASSPAAPPDDKPAAPPKGK